MGQALAKLVLLASTLAGCSWLYDPDRLSAAADAPAEAPPKDCTMPMATGLAPATVSEGMGAGGSRMAVVVISGMNLCSDNVSVTITAVSGSSRTPMLMIDNTKIEVGGFGQQLSVPISLPVDPALRATDMISLDVKIEQDSTAGRVSTMLPGMLKLKGLDELTSAAMLLQGGIREFSQIDVETGTLTNPGNPNGTTPPIVLRSMSSVKITPTIPLDAGGTMGGPAGGKGGTGGTGLGGKGTPGTGPMPGMSNGNSGGFSNSDPGLNTLSDPNRSSGGAGGDGAVVGGQGGDGGGGGGSIEISAGGDLQVGAINARGAKGGGGSLGGVNGGDGSGGVILLRAGGALTAGDMNVGSLGPAGARGRARYDAGGTATVQPGDLGANHLRGPMFAGLPYAFTMAKPRFMVVGKPLSSFKYFFTKQSGGVSSVSGALFDEGGTAMVTLPDALEPGANQLCLITDSGTPTSETRNCATVAYLQ